MTYTTLSQVWFGIWGLIWAIYFVLEGYTTGTGMLFPFLAKKEGEERQLQEVVGPFWGSNEVWLITAAGVTFAAFPKTYGLMFSALYVPFFLILFALFFRATGLEFMHKSQSARWKKSWKWAFFTGSLLIPFLFGAAFSSLYGGLPIDGTGAHVSLGDVFNAYGILGGFTFVSLSLLSGSLWIAIKTEGPVKQRAIRIARNSSPLAIMMLALFFVATTNRTSLFASFGEHPLLWVLPIGSILMIVLTGISVRLQKWGLAFTEICLTIFTLLASGFAGMFPNMLPSNINPSFSLTLYQAAGSQLNLTIMLWVSLVIVPVVIGYQIWMYRIFKEKITSENAKGYH